MNFWEDPANPGNWKSEQARLPPLAASHALRTLSLSPAFSGGGALPRGFALPLTDQSRVVLCVWRPRARRTLRGDFATLARGPLRFLADAPRLFSDGAAHPERLGRGD